MDKRFVVSGALAPVMVLVAALTACTVCWSQDTKDVHSGIIVEIDYDDATDDGHRAGTTPVFDGHRLEGRFWEETTPLIYPVISEKKHLINRLEVHAQKDVLRVRFEGGAYSIIRPAGGDDPLFMEAAFGFRKSGLVVSLCGLQYILLSQDSTRVTITADDQETVRVVSRDPDHPSTLVSSDSEVIEELSDPGKYREYFENVTRVDVEDGRFGAFYLTTFIQRLQIQVGRNESQGVDLFELDLDHTFNDRGQRAVLSRLFFDRK